MRQTADPLNTSYDTSDFLILFPYSSNVQAADDGITSFLSVFSRMACDAGIHLWQQERTAVLLIPGETSYPGVPNTTELMIARAKESGVPGDNLIGLHSLLDGRLLNNTWLQAAAIADLIKSQASMPVRVRIIALEYHLRRVRRACEAFGIAGEYIAAETALGASLEPYERYMPFMRRLQFSEALCRLYGTFDTKGRLASLVTGKAGGRQVDVVEDKGGRLHLENQTAARKLAGVQKMAAPTPAHPTSDQAI